MVVTDTAVRLLQLLSLFQAKPAWTGGELAERMGVVGRTVRRDVARLRDLGYPVEAVPGVAGGYRMGPGGSLPPVLDDEEAVAVAICLRAGAGGSVAGVGEAAASALAKLDTVLPARLRPRVAAIGDATVALHGDQAGVDPTALVVIAGACRQSVRLRFSYADGRGRVTERRAEPYRLVHTGRRWYLVAFDLDRKGWRSFRADRMSAVEATGHTFERHDPPDAAALVAESISTAPYRWKARVVLDAPVAVVAERVPATVAVLEAVDDDTTLLTTGSDDLDAIAVHLAMLDLPFTVEEPAELRERLAVLAERLAAAAAGGAAAQRAASSSRTRRARRLGATNV